MIACLGYLCHCSFAYWNGSACPWQTALMYFTRDADLRLFNEGWAEPNNSCFHVLTYRSLFLSTVHPQRKNMVIVVDHGTSLSESQLHTAKEVAKQVLLSLGPDDRVSRVLLVETPQNMLKVVLLYSQTNQLMIDFCL